MAREINSQGLALIKEFEGLKLTPYKDSAGVLTIGYGHTGAAAKKAAISIDEAEQLLRNDVKWAAAGVEKLLPGLGENTFAALTSFTFNLGVGALEESTLRKRILGGEDPFIVLPEELPKWVKAGGVALPGLMRRRKAEVLLAQKDGPRDQKPAEALPETVSLRPFFHWYRDQKHQLEAIGQLEAEIKKHAPQILSGSAEWVETFRNKPTSLIQLPVPYQWQLDSTTGQGARMCFSSTNAMLVEYLRPGLLRGSQEDDAFLQVVERYGDTTSAEAQVAALKFCGVTASFRQDGTSAKALELLQAKIPVPIGVLHKGTWQNPTGGGHWLLLVGADLERKEWIAHDPFGRMNLKSGNYLDNSPTAGRFVRYAMKELNSRWMVNGEGDGWFVEALV
ncbi:MAG: glycoside hydrolase family protein [Burkholderiaceae bacterium]